MKVWKEVTQFDHLFKAAGITNNVDWRLLKAQAIQESLLDPMAQSPVGAKGIAQFMPATWEEISAKVIHGRTPSIWEPADAIPCQAYYLRQLLDFFEKKIDGGDAHSNQVLQAALAGYNWGMGYVAWGSRKRNIQPAIVERQFYLDRCPEETRKYVPKILSIYKDLST